MRNTIIFDLDGTLMDTLDDLTASVNYCMEKAAGLVYSREDVRQKVGKGVYVLMEKALPGGRENPHYSECIRNFSKHYEKHMLDHTKPFVGIPEVLDHLKAKGYKLAIVSNKFDAAVKELNRQFFADRIDVAIGEAEAKGIRRKPAPDTVFEAMKKLGVRREDSVYVGDSEVDLETAENAGIPCISVTWGFKTAEFLKEHGACHIVNTPEELENCILQGLANDGCANIF